MALRSRRPSVARPDSHLQPRRLVVTASHLRLAAVALVLLSCVTLLTRGVELARSVDDGEPLDDALRLARVFRSLPVAEPDAPSETVAGSDVPSVEAASSSTLTSTTTLSADDRAPAEEAGREATLDTAEDTDVTPTPIVTTLVPTPPPATQVSPPPSPIAMTPPPSPTATTPPPTPIATTPPPTSTPTPPRTGQSQVCYDERDLGLLDRITSSVRVFCNASTTQTTQTTQVTLVDAPAGLRAVVFRDLLLDLSHAVPHGPIASLAQDGGAHDPRFRFTPQTVYCACDAFHAFASTKRRVGRALVGLNVWDPAFAFPSTRAQQRLSQDPSLSCGGINTARSTELTTPSETLLHVPGRVVLLPRRDDHNPFFQVSYALNAWLMLRALAWDPRTVTLIHLDGGYPSPIDALQHQLLAPAQPMRRGDDVMGKRVWFSGDVMIAPFESVGPMMQHLDDTEPCGASELFYTFRAASLAAMEVKQAPSSEQIVVTIISRKPYSGRVVQRRWLNEDDVVAEMRATYSTRTVADKAIVFQSIDFVDLSLQQQMQIMLESDVVISMHGAGMVNVLWTKPETLVIEIFPRQRRRWGFRNLCQHIGCDWHEFRGGKDTGRGDNASDKTIPVNEWMAFFEPLFQNRLAKIAGRSDEQVVAP